MGGLVSLNFSTELVFLNPFHLAEEIIFASDLARRLFYILVVATFFSIPTRHIGMASITASFSKIKFFKLLTFHFIPIQLPLKAVIFSLDAVLNDKETTFQYHPH